MTDEHEAITVELAGQAHADLEAIRPLLQGMWNRVPGPATKVTTAHILGQALQMMRADIEGLEHARLANVTPAGSA